MHIRSATASMVLLVLLTTAARAADAIATYAGDGLTIRVTEWDEEKETTRGELALGGKSYPFTGRMIDDPTADVVRGTFTAGGKQFPFSSRQEEGQEAIVFTSGGKTYKLQPVNGNERPAVEKTDDNPLAGKGETRGGARTADAATDKPAGGDKALPQVMKLKISTIPDVNMGGAPAYTVVTPTDWSAEGKIEWDGSGGTPFPQMHIKITSPEGGRILYVPKILLQYSNAQGMREQGIPPPDNFPQWFTDTLPKANPNVSNVKLIDATRNAKLEALSANIDRQTGANTQGQRRETWDLVYEYDEAGQRRHEETTIMYNAFAPFHGINGFNAQGWGMYFNAFVSAPAKSFEQQKAELYQVAGTLRSTVRWFTASQAIIAQASRDRAANVWDSINRKGREIANMPITASDQSAYSKSYSSDKSQRQRINGIYETDDYKDTDGNTVNLPMYYKHVWSDGQGNYVQSDNSQAKPGESWTEIEAAK